MLQLFDNQVIGSVGKPASFAPPLSRCGIDFNHLLYTIEDSHQAAGVGLPPHQSGIRLIQLSLAD